MTEKIRVLLVDDHALFRSGVKALLERHDDFEVLDEQASETLQRAEGRAVNHHRAVLHVITTNVFQLKSFRKVVIYLYGAQLPTAAQCIFYHKIELRAIEGCLAVFYYGFQAFFGCGLYNGALGFLPVFVATDVFGAVFFVAQRYLCGVGIKT